MRFYSKLALRLLFYLEGFSSDQVIDANKDKAYFTVTPKFGAPPYMVFHPKTGDPLVDQWEVNVWMTDLFKKRYSDFY